MHEFIFRIHKIFQQLLLLGMIQFFFNLNKIYLLRLRTSWKPCFNTTTVPIITNLPNKFSSQQWPNLVKDRLTLEEHHVCCVINRTGLKRVWFNRHFPVTDTECTVIHLKLLYDKFRYVPYMIQYALKRWIWNDTKYLKLKKC